MTETTRGTRSGRRKRAAHLGPERRRPQILDAALEIAVNDGLGAVTIAAVAERLDVTRPVIYSVFSDRVSLVAELLDREAKVLAATAQDSLYASAADTPDEAFRRGFQSFLAAVEEHPQSWRLLLRGRPDPKTAEIHQLGRAYMAKKATSWIGPALAAWWAVEDLDRKLPILIELFISSCEAAARTLLDPDNDWSADELGELYGRVVCAALAQA